MRNPMALVQNAQTAWLEWQQAWLDAWTGKESATRDRRFRDKH